MKIMFKKIEKVRILSAIIVISFVLFGLVLGNKTNLFALVNKLDVKEGTSEEIPLDNWELSTVFYDSSVDNGKTPLTEIDWDASDGSYKDGTPRVITVQINYKNTNAVTTYEPGDLEISIPNLIYANSEVKGTADDAQWTASVVVGANDETHTGYDWDFSSGSFPSTSQKEYTFMNANRIEEKTNFEGSIQIKYTITPSNELPEEYLEECIHSYNRKIKATLLSGTKTSDSKGIESSEINFTYTRTYIHPWQKRDYTTSKYAYKIRSYDGLPSNAKDYYWVKYKFDIYGNKNNKYPYIGIDYYFEDKLPKDCIVLADNFEQITLKSDNQKDSDSSEITSSYQFTDQYIYVGYPKTTYNEKNSNLNINNSADLYIKYNSDKDYKLVGSANVSLNLADFDFSYSGNLYDISKRGLTPQQDSPFSYKSSDLIYQSIIDNSGENCVNWNVSPTTSYTGIPLTIEIGDDLIYLTNKKGDYGKASDDDYYYEEIRIPCIYNRNNKKIKANKYNMRLYVRYANSNKFVKYGEDFKNTEYSYKGIKFSKDEKVVAWYIQIDDMTEGISDFDIVARMRFIKQDINESGTIYNFAYLKVFSKDNTGNLTLINPQEINNYDEFIKKEEIVTYDRNNHNNYIQRAVNSKKWNYYKILDTKINQYISKSASEVNQDLENEKFTGSFQLKQKLDSQYDITMQKNRTLEQVQKSDYHTNFTLYDLLPKGVKLTSTEEDIKNSTETQFYNAYDINKEKAFSKFNSTDFFKKHTKVNITENWKNTGRTRIEIIVDFSEYPLIILARPYCSNSCGYGTPINNIYYTYNYEIPYDSILEYGNIYNNYVYSQTTDDISNLKNSSLKDNGEADSEASDINEDGSTEDKLLRSLAKVTITSVISTHQDVTTYVQTDQSNFSTGGVKSSNNKDYSYKLRVRTGANDITNLVIYDSIEEYTKDVKGNITTAYGSRKHWNGEFLGVDTSYAESKGYKVKVYYSEKENVGTLKEDTSWKEYSDSVDKSKVKSLAFSYLDEEENPAVLPANSLTYVLIKMKSPKDENVKTLTYNGCWTEWNAIDKVTNKPVDFITGINSNIVKIALPNSVSPEDITLTLEKMWEDNNDSKALRPDSITYKLIANDDYVNAVNIILSNTDVDPNNDNHWIKEIKASKYDDNGNEIKYSIKEEEISLSNNYKYTPTIENDLITNTLSKELIITKNWIDNNNTYLTRPSNISVKVLQNGHEYKEVKITGDYSTNTWTGKITVPVYDENNEEYTYSLEEIEVENYQSTYDSNSFTFTNKLIGEEKIAITKVWIDNSNKYNTRPENIKVKLLQNNKEYKTITITGTEDTWKSEEITVPKYDNNGVKYTYTIEETVLINGYGLIEYDQSTKTVTNILKQNMDIIITKNWIDENNSYNTRPSNLNITLLQNDKEYKTITLTGDSSSWTTSVEVPKYDEKQVEYKYTIKEVNEDIVTEYADVTYGEDGLSVTNKLKKNIDLTITKIWIDEDNKYNTRPKSIYINLFQNGVLYKELKLTGEKNTWETNVESVPAYDDNGKKYVYTIEEKIDNKLVKYEKIAYNQTTLTVTNELVTPPKVTLYFTVKNGYTEPGSQEVKFDEAGYKDVLEKHNLNHKNEYIYKFELQNIETGKIYEGKLSTQGILEFPDIPYGTYRAIEGEDRYFDFVSMLSIEDVPGVSFKEDSRGGTITITPTGENIIYGANIINKIEIPIKNPETNSQNIYKIIATLLLAVTMAIALYSMKMKKEF